MKSAVTDDRFVIFALTDERKKTKSAAMHGRFQIFAIRDERQGDQ
jgi:hypothetical protein